MLWGITLGMQCCSGETKLLGGNKVARGRKVESCSGEANLLCARGRKVESCSGEAMLLGGGCSGEKSCSEKVNLLWGEKACFRIICEHLLWGR
ncbi:MAG: hypothetical protein KBC30_10795 [Planctomycetes bacterium]|nr:hypothetical protein [Planctomycetota bacterium]